MLPCQSRDSCCYASHTVGSARERYTKRRVLIGHAIRCNGLHRWRDETVSICLLVHALHAPCTRLTRAVHTPCTRPGVAAAICNAAICVGVTCPMRPICVPWRRAVAQLESFFTVDALAFNCGHVGVLKAGGDTVTHTPTTRHSHATRTAITRLSHGNRTPLTRHSHATHTAITRLSHGNHTPLTRHSHGNHTATRQQSPGKQIAQRIARL